MLFAVKINAEDSLLRFHKVKPVGLSKLPVPLTVAPPGESAIVPGPHRGPGTIALSPGGATVKGTGSLDRPTGFTL